MATIRLLPGYGQMNETVTAEYLLPGYGILNETVAAPGGLTILDFERASMRGSHRGVMLGVG